MARPTKRTPEIIAKLEHAFSMGSTVIDACFHAGIGETTYHDWARADTELSARMQALRQKPVLKALETVYGDLDSVQTAKWYLEKRHPEFKPESKISVAEVTQPEETQAERLERVKALMRYEHRINEFGLDAVEAEDAAQE